MPYGISWATGGGGNARSHMADAQRLTLLIAIADWQLPQAPDGGGGAGIPEKGPGGGLGGPECADRTESPPGGPHYEEVLMREERLYGICLDI